MLKLGQDGAFATPHEQFLVHARSRQALCSADTYLVSN